jgi:hypothetical protein
MEVVQLEKGFGCCILSLHVIDFVATFGTALNVNSKQSFFTSTP